MPSGMFIVPFLVIFLAAALRTFFGWLKSGGEFDPGKFLRTMVIAFVGALIILQVKIFTLDLVILFFAVLNLNYVIDDVRKAREIPRIGQTEKKK